MTTNNETDEKFYKTIGEISRELDLIDKNTGKLQTYTIRYWETQFKQIRPKIKAGGRRYYSDKNIKMIKFIKFLLKERGLTINGVKKILEDTTFDSIDDYANFSVYNSPNKSKNIIKDKVKNISKIIKDLKKI